MISLKIDWQICPIMHYLRLQYIHRLIDNKCWRYISFLFTYLYFYWLCANVTIFSFYCSGEVIQSYIIEVASLSTQQFPFARVPYLPIIFISAKLYSAVFNRTHRMILLWSLTYERFLEAQFSTKRYDHLKFQKCSRKGKNSLFEDLNQHRPKT